MTGINSVLYFAPQLFASLGGSTHTALLSAIVINGTMVVGGFASMYLVEKTGRKPMLSVGGTVMAVSQICVAVVLAAKLDPTGQTTQSLGDGVVYLVLAFICVFTLSFAMTWGPLGTFCGYGLSELVGHANGCHAWK